MVPTPFGYTRYHECIFGMFCVIHDNIMECGDITILYTRVFFIDYGFCSPISISILSKLHPTTVVLPPVLYLGELVDQG